MSNLDHNSKAETSPDKLSHRRRALVKGSAAVVPAILTLRSGSALAATSISCALRIQQNPPVGGAVPAVSTAADDNWLRAKTKCKKVTIGGSDVIVFLDPLNPTQNKWYPVTGNNKGPSVYVDVLPKRMQKMIAPDGKTYKCSTESECWVLVQVDPNGIKTGVVGAAAPGTFPFATDSCAASLSQG
jgi:hypothetical protein